MFNSFLESPEFKEPYFKTSEKDKLITEAYKIKTLKKLTIAEHVANIRELPVIIADEDIEQSDVDNLLVHPYPKDDYEWAENKVRTLINLGNLQ